VADRDAKAAGDHRQACPARVDFDDHFSVSVRVWYNAGEDTYLDFAPQVRRRFGRRDPGMPLG
jgi:hypothetical protein